MNKEKQRIAIAEACGITDIATRQWESVDIDSRSVYSGEWLCGYRHGKLVAVPDYLNDLNAMHAAWETLSPTLQTAFSSVLFDVCGSWHAAANATAEQRAKAFLIVVGKWEDA